MTTSGETDDARSRNGTTRVSWWILVVTAVIGSLWSFQGAQEQDVWCFELLPGAIGVCGVLILARWFELSTLAYLSISVAFVFIAAGARYTYAEVPFPDWASGVLGGNRNSFDRVGHFVQGLTVGLLAREVLARRTTLGKRCGLPVLSVAFALAFSALYELVEWWTVLAFYPDAGPEWLGMQGDPWDAQQDMLMALWGSLATVTLLAPLHDRSIRRLTQQP